MQLEGGEEYLYFTKFALKDIGIKAIPLGFFTIERQILEFSSLKARRQKS
jgi:hypothetical protein